MPAPQYLVAVQQSCRLRYQNIMLMKRLFTTVLALCVLLALHGQNFEGKIVYQNTYKSKLPAVTDEQWKGMLGDRQDYYIKGGDYRSTTNGSLVLWQLYSHQENRLYNKMAGSEVVFWNDGSVNADEVLDFKLNKNATVILGYPCDELILITKNGTQKYYFSSRLAVDARLFTQHKFGNWADYLSRASALPLKQIVESPQLIMESLAIEVTPAPLDAKDFLLPAGIQTAKSPY
jgi:hypothetical protein